MAGSSVTLLRLVGILVGVSLLLGFLSLGLFDLRLGFRGLSLLDRGVFGLDLFDRLLGRCLLGRGLVGSRCLLGQGLVGSRCLLGQGLVGSRGLRGRSLLRGGGATGPIGLR